jgi:hypothetical protein
MTTRGAAVVVFPEHGHDLRREPWEIRRATLTRLVRKAGPGILNGDCESRRSPRRHPIPPSNLEMALVRVLEGAVLNPRGRTRGQGQSSGVATGAHLTSGVTI